MINVPDKPASKKTRRWPMWAVIRTSGHGSIVATAPDAPNAKLRAAIAYSRNDRVDYECWWTQNQRKHNLVLARVIVETHTYLSTPYPRWTDTSKPREARCEWDTGGLVECQCNNIGKHVMQGRRLCGLHLKTAQRTGELRVIVSAQKVTST